MAYKRYMVFYSDEYDNLSPFECLADSFDNLSDAKDSINKDTVYLVEVFDRIKGEIVFTFQGK